MKYRKLKFKSQIHKWDMIIPKIIHCVKFKFSPGWCGSVDWAPACEPKGRQFDSQSGHMPGLLARSPVAGCVRGNPWMNLPHIAVSHPLSLPPFPSLKVNK